MTRRTRRFSAGVPAQTHDPPSECHRDGGPTARQERVMALERRHRTFRALLHYTVVVHYARLVRPADKCVSGKQPSSSNYPSDTLSRCPSTSAEHANSFENTTPPNPVLPTPSTPFFLLLPLSKASVPEPVRPRGAPHSTWSRYQNVRHPGRIVAEPSPLPETFSEVWIRRYTPPDR